MQAETTQVVGHAARGEISTAELDESLAEIGIAEAVGQEAKEDEGVEESLDARALEAEGGCPLVSD